MTKKSDKIFEKLENYQKEVPRLNGGQKAIVLLGFDATLIIFQEVLLQFL